MATREVNFSIFLLFWEVLSHTKTTNNEAISINIFQFTLCDTNFSTKMLHHVGEFLIVLISSVTISPSCFFIVWDYWVKRCPQRSWCLFPIERLSIYFNQKPWVVIFLCTCNFSARNSQAWLIICSENIIFNNIEKNSMSKWNMTWRFMTLSSIHW